MPATLTRLDPDALKANVKQFVNNNKWEVLANMDVENVRDLNSLTTQMANTLNEVTYELGIQKTVSTGPPKLPRKLKDLLLKKNKLAAKIVEKAIRKQTPSEQETDRLQDHKERYKQEHKKWLKHMNQKEIKDICDNIKGNEMKKVWNRRKRRVTQTSNNNLANLVRNKAGRLCITQEEILEAIVEHYNHLANGDPGESRNEEHWRNIDMGKFGEPKEEISSLNEDIT
ncbi:hypothetical protein FRC06_005918 [Ceratobasidium sp. 370]|nr:hypothetical protein FRC06_005918 [Ceratobasidium sp. 370]